jgi:hypothetical protein
MEILPASLSDLMSKVGALVFHWSWLEQRLSDALREHDPARAAGTFKERLAAWHELTAPPSATIERRELASAARDQAIELRRVRNHVVHGLQSADARPEKGPPTIRCLIGGHDDPAAGTVRYTVDDLEHFAQAMDACRRAFIRVESFNYRL